MTEAERVAALKAEIARCDTLVRTGAGPERWALRNRLAGLRFALWLWEPPAGATPPPEVDPAADAALGPLGVGQGALTERDARWHAAHLTAGPGLAVRHANLEAHLLTTEPAIPGAFQAVRGAVPWQPGDLPAERRLAALRAGALDRPDEATT